MGTRYVQYDTVIRSSGCRKYVKSRIDVNTFNTFNNVKSKDIGQYYTCPHLCEYCYANTSKEVTLANWKAHLMNPKAESIVTIYLTAK